jgi:hypothetical protein
VPREPGATPAADCLLDGVLRQLAASTDPLIARWAQALQAGEGATSDDPAGREENARKKPPGRRTA